MLSPEETSNCRNLLLHLPQADILSLCETVSNRLIVPTSLEEAVEVILRYSKSSQELIGRKKVKADVLFRYLQSVGVNVSPKSSKTELVGKTLDLWRESSTAVAPNPSQRETAPIQIHNEINYYNYTLKPNEDDTGQKLAFDFVNWFYPILRSLHESAGTEKWGPQHFLPGSTLVFRVTTTTDNNVHQELCEGPEAEKVVLNPNTTIEGCRGVLSPHGLGKVAVLGTMHKHSDGKSGDVVGLFEQMFGLMRDLNDGNNYKIKHCELRIIVAGQQWRCNQQQSLTEDALKFLEN